MTPFWALNGFRGTSEICSYLSRCCPKTLKTALEDLAQSSTPDGLKRFFKTLMTLDTEQRRSVIHDTLETAKALADTDDVYPWVISLHRSYPDDIGILSPLFLNLIRLEPGQALFLEAGELHAYLDGLGIELMANSDNVLRGGLTPKHIDVAELVKILDFKQKKPNVLSPRKQGEFEVFYDSRAAEFVLSVICLPVHTAYTSPVKRSVEILLCTDGQAMITDITDDDSLVVPKGTSVLVPAAVEGYRLSGKAVLYKASVPI